MTTKPRILVTLAVGRTGAVAVLELLRKGFPVRAFVRRNDGRSETLRKEGADPSSRKIHSRYLTIYQLVGKLFLFE